MRIKPVPEPPAELRELAAFQQAVPLVSGTEDDCCARLRDRRGLPDRQVANDWLAFLRALGLAAETPRGFKRTEAEPTAERVRDRLREGVLFAPEAIELLRASSPDDPVTAEDLFSSTRRSVPRHDRARDPNWEATWRDRAGRLLRWFELVDLAERAELPVEERGSRDRNGTGDETEADDGSDGDETPSGSRNRRTVGYVAGDAL